MSIQKTKHLTRVINTRGTFTPLGVSRSSEYVGKSVSEALGRYFIIEELQALASTSVSRLSGAEAATITHCTAGSITVAIAATMTGSNPEKIAALPDTSGMKDGVVIPSQHCVSYGHSIMQAIRLSGARPVVAGVDGKCSLREIEQEVSTGNITCLLLVSSKLTNGTEIDLKSAVEMAHRYNVPVIIDGAAQDFRIQELIDTGADLVLVSAQKYLAAPTAGIVAGKEELVQAVRAQEKGIGRAMKATKEAIIGVLAAVEERNTLDMKQWIRSQKMKVERFVTEANKLPAVTAFSIPDPTGLPFSRAHIQFEEPQMAVDLVQKLKDGDPSIWVIDQNAPEGELAFELVQTTKEEIDEVLTKIQENLA